ncbi:hypothetical protein [Zooshikella sp. RANM57]|uniref:hypothetical protein n=1 Tax=Zooshikella sp. RANM57 TaxID=3425863 RepID=UPI003D6DCE0D
MNETLSESFKKSIKNGTGEAILLLKENPSANFDQYILKACTHNLAYDPQCEGSRAEYLFEILSLARNKEKIVNEIIRQLNSPNKEYWDIQLLFDLAAIIAKQGNQEAKKAIYQRYSNNLNPEFEFADTNVLVALDGLNGLKFVAETQGRKIELDHDYWVDDRQLQVCKEYFPESSPKNYLAQKAQSNKYINVYLTKIEEIESLRTENATIRGKRSLSQLLKLIDEGKRIPIIAGKWLTDEEVVSVAKLLLHEKDEKKIEAYLRLLLRAKYPLDISNLLPLLITDNKQIKHSILRILSKIKDNQIRELIDKNYTDLTYLNDHLEFFVSNFFEKDLKVLSRILDTLDDDDEIHYFGMIIKDIFDGNSIKHPRNLLVKLYSATNCSICRESFIKILISANQISDKILRELRYDCERDIRQLANEYTQKC